MLVLTIPVDMNEELSEDLKRLHYPDNGQYWGVGGVVGSQPFEKMISGRDKC